MRVRVLLGLLLAFCFSWGMLGTALAQVVSQIPRSPSWQMVPPKLGPQCAWIEGHWQWNGQRYAWISGHYERRPNPGSHWIDGHWQRVAGGWQYVQGYWTSPVQEWTTFVNGGKSGAQGLARAIANTHSPLK